LKSSNLLASLIFSIFLAGALSPIESTVFDAPGTPGFLTAEHVPNEVFSRVSFPAFGASVAHAADDEEPSLVDEKLLNEFMDKMKKFHTNATCIGTTVMQINGADSKSKYVSYMLDINNKCIESENLGDKCTLVVTPDEAWYYFPQNRLIVSFKGKRILASLNSVNQINKIKENGRLQKKEKDGDIIYTLTDFTNNYRFTYYFDAKTNLLTHSVTLDNNNGKETETTYAGWEQKKIDRDKFVKPSGCTEKNGDNY